MLVINNKGEWNNILQDNFTKKDVYFNYEYFELFKTHYGAKPEALFWEDGNIKIFWTHLVRNISKLDFFNESNYRDLTTPYGYGGPIIEIVNQRNAKTSLSTFFKEYYDYAKKQRYISEFIRFHPFFRNNILFEFIDLENINDVVWIDLSLKIEDIWNNMNKAHRYCVRKSIENGCKVNFINEPTAHDIKNFNDLYGNTMIRNKALPKYHFSKEFIDDNLQLADSLLVEVVLNGKVIGSSIFLLGDDIIHYHLSGAEIGLKKIFPSHLILFEVIKWAKEMNFHNFLLGGGRGSNDSLFKFKKGFSRSCMPFFVGKLKFDSINYDKLVIQNPKYTKSNGYFPKYRFGLDNEIL